MLSLLALIPLGGVEVCMYTDLTIGGPTEDCSGNVNQPVCEQAGDHECDTCSNLGGGTYQKITCSGDTITWAYHAKADCSDALSRTCNFVDIDASKVVESSCSIKSTNSASAGRRFLLWAWACNCFGPCLGTISSAVCG